MKNSNKKLDYNVPSISTGIIKPGGALIFNSFISTKAYNSGIVMLSGKINFYQTDKKIYSKFDSRSKNFLGEDNSILTQGSIIKDELWKVETLFDAQKPMVMTNETEEDSEYVCFTYLRQFNASGKRLGLGADLIKEKRNKNKKFIHMSYKEHPNVYANYRVKDEINLDLPKDHIICLYRGNIFVNGQEKKHIAWIKSTKNQTVNIINKDKENDAIICLLRTELE